MNVEGSGISSFCKTSLTLGAKKRIRLPAALQSTSPKPFKTAVTEQKVCICIYYIYIQHIFIYIYMIIYVSVFVNIILLYMYIILLYMYIILYIYIYIFINLLHIDVFTRMSHMYSINDCKINK